MLACIRTVSGADTTVKVSRETLNELEGLRLAFNVRTADETIRELIRERRSRVLSRVFGSAEGMISSFSEADRLDSDD